MLSQILLTPTKAIWAPFPTGVFNIRQCKVKATQARGAIDNSYYIAAMCYLCSAITRVCLWTGCSLWDAETDGITCLLEKRFATAASGYCKSFGPPLDSPLYTSPLPSVGSMPLICTTIILFCADANRKKSKTQAVRRPI